MSTDEEFVRKRVCCGIGTFAITVLLGASLIVFAIPRIAAYGTLLPVKSRITPALVQGGMLPPDMLDASIRAYVSAAGWLPGDADIEQTLARLYLRRALDAQGDEIRRARALQDALDRIDCALGAAPNRHFSWALRAEILRMLGRPESEVEAAVRLSYLLGPYQASSMLLRVQTILSLWNEASPEMREIVGKDLEKIWHTDALHSNLAALYLRQPLSSRMRIREVVLNSKEDVDAFNLLISRQVSRRK